MEEWVAACSVRSGARTDEKVNTSVIRTGARLKRLAMVIVRTPSPTMGPSWHQELHCKQQGPIELASTAPLWKKPPPHGCRFCIPWFLQRSRPAGIEVGRSAPVWRVKFEQLLLCIIVNRYIKKRAKRNVKTLEATLREVWQPPRVTAPWATVLWNPVDSWASAILCGKFGIKRSSLKISFVVFETRAKRVCKDFWRYILLLLLYEVYIHVRRCVWVFLASTCCRGR